MVKSILVCPEALGAAPLTPGRIPPGTQRRLEQAAKAGWQGQGIWLAEQYYEGKHAYASFIEIHCDRAIGIPVRAVRRDLVWLYLLQGAAEVTPPPSGGGVGDLPLRLEQGHYAPVFIGAGNYTFNTPPGYHRLLVIVAQLKWMERYAETTFAPICGLLRGNGRRFLAGTINTIGTRHLRCIAHLRQLAHGASFRQDVALYEQLVGLFDSYLKDIEAPAVAKPGRWHAMEAKVYEITAYLAKEIAMGNVTTPDELAEAFELNKKTLYRHFRKVLGQTPMEYMQRIRMDEAKRLLTVEHVAPVKVAYQLGYTHLRTFQRAFKSYYGVTPKKTHRHFRETAGCP